MPVEEDCIINGTREISFPSHDDSVQNTPAKFTDNLLNKVQITVPIDQVKAEDAEERVKRYRIQR